MTAKGRMNEQERADTLVDLRELVAAYKAEDAKCKRMTYSLQMAIAELEASSGH